MNRVIKKPSTMVNMLDYTPFHLKNYLLLCPEAWTDHPMYQLACPPHLKNFTAWAREFPPDDCTAHSLARLSLPCQLSYRMPYRVTVHRRYSQIVNRLLFATQERLQARNEGLYPRWLGFPSSVMSSSGISAIVSSLSMVCGCIRRLSLFCSTHKA